MPDDHVAAGDLCTHADADAACRCCIRSCPLNPGMHVDVSCPAHVATHCHQINTALCAHAAGSPYLHEYPLTSPHQPALLLDKRLLHALVHTLLVVSCWLLALPRKAAGVRKTAAVGLTGSVMHA